MKTLFRIFSGTAVAVTSVVTFSTAALAATAPVAPAAPVATAKTASSITISWAAPADTGGSAITKYEVAKNGVLIASPTLRQLTVQNLAASTSYDFTVKACNAIGCSDPSAVLTTSTTPLPATLLTWVPGSGSLTLAWTSNGGAGSVDSIWYRPSSTSVFSEWTPGQADTSPTTVTGLTNGLSHSWKVRTTSDAGWSETAPVVATPTDVPAPVTLTYSNLTTTSLTLNIPPAAGAKADSYAVFRDGVKIATPAASATTSVSVTGLVTLQRYSFTAEACNKAGCSALSSALEVTIPPTPPSRVVGVAGPSKATISWTSAPGDYAHSLQYRASPSTVWVDFTPGVADTSPTEITGLAGGVLHYFRVGVTATDGTPSFSQPISLMPQGPPASPTALRQSPQAVPTATSAGISWTKASDGGAPLAGYKVFREGVLVAQPGPAATTAVLTGLTVGDQYAVTLQACNSIGCSVLTSALNVLSMPLAPANVAIAASSNGGVVSWDAATTTAIPSYKVFFRKTGITTWTELTPNVNDVSGATLTGLTATTGYQVYVRAFTAAGKADSVVKSFTTGFYVRPSSPQNVTAVAGLGSATVAWKSPASSGGTPVTNYVVEQSIDAGTTWVTVPKSISIILSLTVGSLSPGTSYLFRVSAVNAIGTSTPQTASAAVTPVGVSQPPASVTGTAGPGQVVLSWVAPTDNGGSPVTDYLIQHSTNATTWTAFSDGVSPTTSATVLGLANGTAYTFRVAAVTAAGPTAYVASAAAYTPLAAPGPPTRPNATPANTSVTISWSAPANTGGTLVLDYQVELSTDAGVTWNTVTDAITSATTTTVTGLTNGTSYTFRVAAINAVGTGTASAASLPTSPRTVPGIPTSVTATAAASSATLVWVAPVDNGGSVVTDYRIQYSTNATTWVTFSDGANPATSVTVTGLTNGTSYSFRVAAINAAGASDNSDVSNIVAPRAAPAAPIGLAGVPGENEALLRWTAPVANGAAITDYVIEISQDATASWTVVADGESALTNATVASLTDGTTYSFKVAAVNATGKGPYSTPVTVVVDRSKAAPSGLAGVAQDAKVALTWNAPTAAGTTITDYAVLYSSDAGTTWATFADGISVTRTATVQGLANLTAYTFKVAPVTLFGTGAFSPVAGPITPHAGASAVSNLTAAAGNTTAALEWEYPASDAGFPVTSYVVESSANAGGTWATIATLTAPVLSYTATALTNGTTYQFRVTADNGVIGQPAVVSSTPATTSAVPTAVTAANSGASVLVTWAAPSSTGGSPITDYTVQFSSDSGASWTALTKSASTTRSATLAALVTGTSYVFRVAAVNAVGESAFSAQSLPVVAKSKPSAPTAPAGSPGAGSVTLTWAAPAETGGYPISNYLIQRSADSGATWTSIVRSVSTVRVATISGLTNGTPYVFRVAAINSAGTSEFSPASSSITPLTIPSAVRTIVATAGATEVALSWLAPLSDGGSALTDYLIEYSSNSGQTWTPFADAVSTELSATVTGLTNGTAYLVRVAAANDAGKSPWTNAASVTPRDVPFVPGSVTATPGLSRLTVTWTAPTSNGGAAITDYVLEISADAGTTWAVAADLVSTTLSGSITNLTAGTSYVVRVAAKNSVGTGQFSTPSAPATPYATPSSVVNVASAAGAGQVVLSWDAPVSNGGSAVTDYTIEFSTNNTTWTKFTDGVSTATTATVTGLSNGQEHYFRIAAVNAVGTSAWASAPPATPSFAPASPTGLVATPANAAVSLSWSAPAPNSNPAVTDYLVEFSTDSGSTWTTFSDGISASTTATVTGLTNGTSYTFRVSAVSIAGTSSASTPSSSVTPAVPLAMSYPTVAIPANNTAQSFSPTVTGALAAPSFSISGALPAGVTFNPTTGTLSTTGLQGNSTGALDSDWAVDQAGNTTSPGANNAVNAVALQSDGKIIIGGQFTTINGASRTRIARLNADGSLDTSFGDGLTVTDNTVNAIALQSDGKIVIGGAFSTVNDAARNYIARLNADGSLDTSFGNGLAGASDRVDAVAVQSDGKIVIGGDFTTVNGTTRNRIARLNADGSLDTSFGNGLAGVNNVILDVAVQSDGKVVLGGMFTTVNGATRNRIARLNADGTLDTSFGNGLTGATEIVRAVALQSDGKIVIGGAFITVNGATRTRIARLNADGTLDTSFGNGLTGANDTVFTLAAQSDGKIAIGGDFTAVNGTTRNYIAHLNADGTLDTSFGNGLTGASNTVFALAAQSDGKVVIGGFFTAVNGTARNNIARLNSGGTLDASFGNGVAGASSSVNALAVQSDGKIIIGADFTAINGAGRNYIARLNADGSLDTSFGNGLAGANSSVMTVAVQSNGKIVIGGWFTTINGAARNYIARLNADGTLDTSFGNGLAGTNSAVYAVALQADGKIVIGGSFTTVNGASRNRIARLNADGTLDTSFGNGLTAADGTVYAVAAQSDGKVVIGGSFTTVNGASRNRIARLNADGTLDTSFGNGLTAANGTVWAVAAQSDGKVVIGGSFTTINGASRTRIARLNADGSLDTSFGNGLTGADSTVYALAVQSDNKIIIGGDFTTVNGAARNYAARLNADGTLDTFGNGLAGPDGSVYALAVQSDGKIVIGGWFTTVNGTTSTYIARLDAPAPAATTVTITANDGSRTTTASVTVTPTPARPNPVTGLSATAGASSFSLAWSAPVATALTVTDYRIEYSTDLVNWTTFADGVSTASTATVTGLSAGVHYFFQVRSLADATASAPAGTPNAVFIPAPEPLALAYSQTALPVTGSSASLMPTVSGGYGSYSYSYSGVLPAGVSFSTSTGAFSTTGLAKSSTGALDASFGNGLSGANNVVNAFAIQPDGKVLIGGNFTTINGTPRNYVARLNDDGTLDTTFGNGLVGNGVYAMAVQPDGKILIAGDFTTINGTARGYVARLNADGTLDTTFGNGLTGADGGVYALAVQPDGKVVIGGYFTTVNGTSRGRIARLNADGTLDTSFGNGLAGSDRGLIALALQTDGKVVIVGYNFTTVNGVARSGIARLNADGTLDTTFGDGLSGTANVYALAVQPDGKIVIGGDLLTVNGTSRGRIARLNADGTLDTSFGNGLAGASHGVSAIGVQADGKIVIGGNFTTVNGTARVRIARLNVDGTLDTSFGSGLAGANFQPNALAIQPNGKVLIGGAFTTVNGITRNYIARLDNETPAFTSTPISVTVTSGALSVTTAVTLTPG